MGGISFSGWFQTVRTPPILVGLPPPTWCLLVSWGFWLIFCEGLRLEKWSSRLRPGAGGDAGLCRAPGDGRPLCRGEGKGFGHGQANVDPNEQTPVFENMGLLLPGLSGESDHFWRGTPTFNELELINMGSPINWHTAMPMAQGPVPIFHVSRSFVKSPGIPSQVPSASAAFFVFHQATFNEMNFFSMARRVWSSFYSRTLEKLREDTDL